MAYPAEGPVWSERWGALRWVDMLAADVLSLSGDGMVGRRHVGRIVAVLRPRLQEDAVLSVERGFGLEHVDETLTYQDPLWTTDRLQMNEGGCDPMAGATTGRWRMTATTATAPCTGSIPTSPWLWSSTASRSPTGSTGARTPAARISRTPRRTASTCSITTPRQG